MDSSPNPTAPPSKKPKKQDKSLMRLQNPIYQLKQKNQSDPQYIIRKLMDRKDIKPKIQPVQRSPLLKELAAMLPIFKKANEELKERVIQEKDKIDAKLEIVEDSSSSSEEEEEEQQVSTPIKSTMLIKPVKTKQQSEMIDQNEHQQHQQQQQQQQMEDIALTKDPTTNQIQLNFVRYELPLVMHKTEENEKNQQESEDVSGKGKGNKKLIQEL